MNYPGLVPDRDGEKGSGFFYWGRQINKELHKLFHLQKLKLEGSTGNARLTDKFGIVVSGSDAGTLQLLLVPRLLIFLLKWYSYLQLRCEESLAFHPRQPHVFGEISACARLLDKYAMKTMVHKMLSLRLWRDSQFTGEDKTQNTFNNGKLL